MKSKIQSHVDGSSIERRISESEGSDLKSKAEPTSTQSEIFEAEAEAKEKRETGRTWDVSDWMSIS